MWNQGEENNTPDPDRKAIARYLRELDPYDHPITVHTHNNKAPDFYNGLLGEPFFEASSIQGDMKNYNRDAIVLRERTAKAGRPWAVFGDEQPSANIGVLPDNVDPAHDVPRKQALWGNLMGGGSGVEWYFGYAHPHMDLNCEDFRSRDGLWDQTRHALTFFQKHLPFWRMAPDNTLVTGAPAYILATAGEVYAAYLPEGGAVALRLEPGRYSVHWYDPRNGGDLQTGSVKIVEGSGSADPGVAPAGAGEDWVVLLRRMQ
jgi:hypothetical protein